MRIEMLRPRYRYAIAIAAGLLILIFVVRVTLGYLDMPTHTFPVEQPVTIPEGTSTAGVAMILKEHGLIRSIQYFDLIMRTVFKNAYVRAGSYVFPSPMSTSDVARALINGTFGEPPAKLVFPEGMKISQMTTTITDAIPTLNAADVEKALDANIGYLFPDTYFVSHDTTVDALVTLMRDTFDKKTKDLFAAYNDVTLSKSDVVTLASLVEREANSEESMRIVAGILEKRLVLHMPLQVDATFAYETGKPSSELTADDLATTSPYNTYTRTGLPPTPIANPGLTAIKAVLDPEKTPYLYYLTDADGNFHYARTFEEHKRNKALYLR